MRVVLDSVILVRGLIGPHGQWGRILFDRNKEFRWIVSAEIVEEYLDVLTRPEVVRKYRSAGTRDVAFVLELIAGARIVAPDDIPSICRDPEDDKFLAAANEGEAHFIVTEDSDLLSLKTFEGISICTAEQFLRHLDEGVS